MREAIPNVQLRAWRNARNWTRADMADALNRTPTGQQEHLACDEERIRRWETGEAKRPRSIYRRALEELTGESIENLGFVPADRAQEPRLVAGRTAPRDAMQAEAELFDTLELAEMAERSDIGPGTVEAIHEAVELLCRAYPVAPAATLRRRTKERLHYVMQRLSGRITLAQHRELLVAAGWLSLLLGCVHYDLGEREQAEAARQAAYQMGKQIGDTEIMAWSFEISAWFALVDERYDAANHYAQAGQAMAGTSNAAVQLALQQARAQARIGDRRGADEALTRGAAILGRLPMPEHPDHHFVFDHSKWLFYAASCYVALGDDDRAEEHALEVITQHSRPDGSSRAPMRTADAQIDLGIVHARRGELDAAVEYGRAALDHDRRSAADLLARADDLNAALRERYRGERLAQEFAERYMNARHEFPGS